MGREASKRHMLTSQLPKETSSEVVLAADYNHPKRNNHKWKTPDLQKKNECKLEKKIENHHKGTPGAAAPTGMGGADG